MPQVYPIAERLRVLRGGAAVVLGALSPRTRNAQVALFQAGAVDYLVATDAIGMGLNLGVTHVAFAGMRKFDGHGVRDLDPAELAQIAGRAGRYTTDGTFGTVAPQGLPPELAQAIELHRFPAIRRVFYRNTDLDFRSIDALTASLRQRPRSNALRLVEHAEDAAALAALAQVQIADLTARDRELLAELEVVIGGRVVYASALLKRAAVAQRAALSATYFDGRARPSMPRAGSVSMGATPGVAPTAYLLIGYPVFGARAIRADVSSVSIAPSPRGRSGKGSHRALPSRSSRASSGARRAKCPRSSPS